MNLAQVFSATAVLISIFSFLFFRSYLKRRTSHERILAELREEVNIILKSINETTERDISLIEEREKILRRLLAEVEKRIKLYIKELDVRKKADETYMQTVTAQPAQASSEAELSIAETYQELGKKRYKLTQTPVSPEAPAGEAPIPEPAAPEPAAPKPAAPKPPPSFNEQISVLKQSGLSVPQIAAQLGKSIAEVEFAAALLERRED